MKVVILEPIKAKDNNRRAFMSRQEYRDFMREYGPGGSKVRCVSDAQTLGSESSGAGSGLGRFTLPPKVKSDLIEGRKLLESARTADEPKKD